LKKEISCLETRLDSAEFCISSCLSRMAKMEVWMRKVQDKMDGVVPEVLNSEVRLIGHACAFRPHICRRRR